jgi:hypothetical protein
MALTATEVSDLAAPLLTHNWGTEDFEYHNGNRDPRGFDHIMPAVPDVCAAKVERFVQRQERLSEAHVGARM